VRGAFVVSAGLVLIGCGGRGPPARAPPLGFTIDETAWVIEAPGARHTRGDYAERFSTESWTIEVRELPRSDLFAQTLADDLAISAKYHPGREVLFQRDGGPDDWATVTRIADRIYGAQKISGATNLLCTFELPRGADWRPALAACGTIRPDRATMRR
jgi:hypothetical protein